MLFTFRETIFGVNMKTNPQNFYETYWSILQTESWMIPPNWPGIALSSMRFICSRIRSLNPLPACKVGNENSGLLKTWWTYDTIWMNYMNCKEWNLQKMFIFEKKVEIPKMHHKYSIWQSFTIDLATGQFILPCCAQIVAVYGCSSIQIWYWCAWKSCIPVKF
jgi:hypothetical protein